MLMKDVLFRAHDIGLLVRFTPISIDSYHTWVSGQGKARYIVTLLARKITVSN